MRALQRLADWIDDLSRRVGHAVSWLTLVMVLIAAGNAVARYLGRFLGANLSSNTFLEAQWYLFSVVFLLGAAWTLQEDAHVRVDVIYGRLPARGRAAIDLAGGLLFLLPFCVLALWFTVPTVLASWATGEVSPDPGGLARYPIKTVVLVAFVLLALQGVAQIIKAILQLSSRDGPAVGAPELDGASELDHPTPAKVEP